MTFLTFTFNDSIVPISNRFAENTLRESLGKSIGSEEGKHIMFSRYGSQIYPSNEVSKSQENLTHIFYAKYFRNNFMEEVTLIDFSRIGIEQILKSEKAEYDQKKNLWKFYNGRLIITKDNDGNVYLGGYYQGQVNFNHGGDGSGVPNAGSILSLGL